MPEYDKNSANSIYEYAKRLTGKSLVEVALQEGFEENLSDKGNLGTLVEKYFFKHTPPNTHEPDFPEAELELKTTGLIKTSSGYRAKERLVLTMINYNRIVDEEWHSSSLWKKCKRMLILFYEYDKSKSPIRRKFVLDPLLYQPSKEDIQVIQKDWLYIQEKVRAGKAHELSEGDTFYLGACRKGSGGEDEYMRSTPGDSPRAKSRAFSLKPSFVNMLLTRNTEDYSLINNSGIMKRTNSDSIEAAVEKSLESYIGLTVNQIADLLGIPQEKRDDKGFNFNLVRQILSESNTPIPELVKAGVETKTVRREANGIVRESMSFPAFKFKEIVNQDWEQSDFAEKLEKKFLFVLFQKRFSDIEASENGVGSRDNLLFQGAKFWNMSYADRLEAKKVFEETKKRIWTSPTNLPSSKENRVSHVRPKAANKNDTYPLPQGGHHTKQCFWLNNSYVKEIVNQLFENQKN